MGVVFPHSSNIKLVSQSFGVSLTTVAECTMGFLTFYTTSVVLYTTICSVSNLCVMQGSSFVDLLLDEIQRIHSSTPKVVGFLGPFL